jgi:hypothetical protein
VGVSARAGVAGALKGVQGVQKVLTVRWAWALSCAG